MKLRYDIFRGIVPKISPSKLPQGAAQIANNVRVLSGDLEPWNGLGFVAHTVKTGTHNTIFKLNDVWLNWLDSELGTYAQGNNVDVALGPIPGDTSFRYYATGLPSSPRVSNYDFSTNDLYRNGAAVGAYPYRTFYLGVPAPGLPPTASSVVGATTAVFASGSENPPTPAPWATAFGGPPVFDAATMGTNSTKLPAFTEMHGNYTVGTVNNDLIDFAFRTDTAGPAATNCFEMRYGCDVGGNGPYLRLIPSYTDGTGFHVATLEFGQAAGWHVALTKTGSAAVGTDATNTLKANTNYFCSLTITKDAAGVFHVTVYISEIGGSGIVFLTNGMPNPTGFGPLGTYGGFHSRGGNLWVRAVNVGQTVIDQTQVEDTEYIVTNVNILGEESQESPSSAITQRSPQLVTSITSIPSMVAATDDLYGVIGHRLYRAVTGASGTSFQLVVDETVLTMRPILDGQITIGANDLQSVNGTVWAGAQRYFTANDVGKSVSGTGIPAKTTIASYISPTHVTLSNNATATTSVGQFTIWVNTYTDQVNDTALGEPLATDGWALPPGDLQGILMLPNGIAAGYSKNQLYLSAQNHPHAWPITNTLAVDKPIVAIGAIDTSVVILTEGHAYLAFGNSPDAYTMTKMPLPQGCSSKQSLAYLKSQGVVYASPNGLMSVAGPGQHINLTSKLFSRREWQALNPSSLVAVAHDERVFLFNGTKGIVIDFEEQVAFSITLSAKAIFVDPQTDAMNLIATTMAQPSSSFMRLIPTLANRIYEWDADTGTYTLTPQWIGPKERLPIPAAFNVMQVKAADYTDLTVRLYANGVQFFEKNVTDASVFTVPAQTMDAFALELTGSSRTVYAEIAESVEELS